jgi:NAD(P)H-dependent FMN reductase
MNHHIVIISSSVRNGRKSHRVSLFFKSFIEQQNIASVEILDLKEYNFPIFDERLKNLSDPPTGAKEFAAKIKNASGVIIVTPEYNGGYPASLKNVIDLLYDEWRRKPIAIASVSDGIYAGSQVLTSLQFTLWKIGALMVPAMYRVGKVEANYDEQGKPLDDKIPGFAKKFVDELMYYIQLTMDN